MHCISVPTASDCKNKTLQFFQLFEGFFVAALCASVPKRHSDNFFPCCTHASQYRTIHLLKRMVPPKKSCSSCMTLLLNRPRARSVIPSFPLPPFCLADLWALLLLLFGHVYLHMGFPPQKARLESVDEMKMNPTRRQIWHEQTNPIALTTFVFPYDMLNVPCLKWDT